jgi:hypothetical protein
MPEGREPFGSESHESGAGRRRDVHAREPRAKYTGRRADSAWRGSELDGFVSTTAPEKD